MSVKKISIVLMAFLLIISTCPFLSADTGLRENSLSTAASTEATPPPLTCREACQKSYGIAVQAAAKGAAVCIGFGSLACGVGCVGATIGYPLCMAACITIVTGGCLTAEAVSLQAAQQTLAVCLAGCPA